MKTFCRLAMLTLVLSVIAATALAQDSVPPPVVLSNIVEGMGTITNGGSNWAGFSELVLIPGSDTLNVKGATNFFYLGFVGGSTVDIGHMVLYKTARNSTTVLTVKPVKLGAVLAPSIVLTSPSVCPTQPVSLTNPCFVKLDVVKGALSPLFDYYLAMYFSNDSNNAGGVFGAGQSQAQGGLSGYFVLGDQTRIKKNGTLPPGYNGAAPFFVTAVANQ